MSEVICPYCGSNRCEISENDNNRDVFDIYDMKDGDILEFICKSCLKVFDVKYLVKRLVEEEFLTYPKTQPEDILKECPGQMFLWEDLKT
jgi:hypothetical protein